MYEILFGKTFHRDLGKNKSLEYLLANKLSIFATNPSHKSLKTIVVRDIKELYGCYRSEIDGKFYVYWRYGRGKRIEFLGLKTK